GLARSIGRPLQRVQRAAGAAADGDLSVEVEADRNDEVGQVARAFQQLVVYLRDVSSVADAVAGVDLTREVQVKSEHDVLGSAVVRMIEHLRDMVAQLQVTAEQLQAMSA